MQFMTTFPEDMDPGYGIATLLPHFAPKKMLKARTSMLSIAQAERIVLPHTGLVQQTMEIFRPTLWKSMYTFFTRINGGWENK